jgi:hypothetical protein
LEPSPQIKLHQQYLSAKTLRLLPEKADAKLTMKEKMRATFKKSELPNVNFHVMFTFPTQLWPGGDCPLKICVRYGRQSEDLPEKPPIYLDSVMVEVKTYVVARAPGAFGEHNDSDSRTRTILHRIGLHTALPEIESAEKVVESRNQWCSISRTVPDGITVSPSLSLDFSTYNIATYNRIEVKLRISCADKQFSVSTTAPLRVLPPISSYSGVPTTTSEVVAGPSREAATARVDTSDAGPSDPQPPPPYIPAPTYDSLDSEIPQKGENTGTVV